jgi:hypothetical protein
MLWIADWKRENLSLTAIANGTGAVVMGTPKPALPVQYRRRGRYDRL